MAVRSFEDLIVWQKSMDLVTEVYSVTAGFPSDERFGLTQQLRRAAVSIPSNMAEGQGRSTTTDFIRFLTISRGSLNEVRTQLIIANHLNYLTNDKLQSLRNACDEIARLLNALINSLTSKQNTNH
jgi:four helix bundle protein